ncbi:hypothetical protein POM88_011413 [Heracleum sosnowskyi]|uniref:Uncharacterized protein n=1 Tax=Heracleum sosnowskyi TaxID=360622 RepID=A0AAD8N1K0_9APIA|nr:hypothetical protein POM88_011413 [Heracleum sosnowskyi]
MPGRRVLSGKSKLCQRKFPGSESFALLITRFPESNNCAMGFFKDFEEFDDQILLFAPLKILRVPSLLKLSMPDELVRGVSRLATHAVVPNALLYRMLNQVPIV